MNSALDQYIAELLYDYDCVIVPQLGGFVTNYRPAHIDVRKGLASPPGKDIRFNRNLTKNDGLLTSACAEANGWTFEEAGSYVRKEVEGYLSALNEGEKVKLKKIGILFIDEQKNLRFEPDGRYNFLKQSWGFETFTLPEALPEKAPKPEAKVLPLPQAEPALEEAETTEALPADGTYGRSAHTKSMYWVAAATLLPFVAFSLLLGAKTGFKSPAELSAADLNPFAKHSTVDRMYHPGTAGQSSAALAVNAREASFPEGMERFPYSFSTGKVDSTGVWIDLARHDENASASQSAAFAGKKTYHIIGGCFGERANAENYVGQMRSKGYDAGILDHHKGLHRVAISSFDAYDEALQALELKRNTQELKGAWLLKKL